MLTLATKDYIKAQAVHEKVIQTLRNEEGQTGGEYGMVLVLVLAVDVPIIVTFRNQLTNVIQTVTTAIGTR
jgi:Flp pilus assembly pilin Flp